MSLEDKNHVTLNELSALLEWSEKHELSGIESLIRSGDISPAARDIIADIFTGKRRRKKGAKSTEHRDSEIYSEILNLLANGHKLTSSSYNRDGAAAIVADTRGLNEDAVIKAYQRINTKWKPIYKGIFEQLLNDSEFWQSPEAAQTNLSREEFKEILNKKKF